MKFVLSHFGNLFGSLYVKLASVTCVRFNVLTGRHRDGSSFLSAFGSAGYPRRPAAQGRGSTALSRKPNRDPRNIRLRHTRHTGTHLPRKRRGRAPAGVPRGMARVAQSQGGTASKFKRASRDAVPPAPSRLFSRVCRERESARTAIWNLGVGVRGSPAWVRHRRDNPRSRKIRDSRRRRSSQPHERAERFALADPPNGSAASPVENFHQDPHANVLRDRKLSGEHGSPRM